MSGWEAMQQGAPDPFFETPRERFDRLMAEGRIEEAERYLQALEMFVALAGKDSE